MGYDGVHLKLLMGENFDNDNEHVVPATAEELLGLHPDFLEIIGAQVRTQRCIRDAYTKGDYVPDCPHPNTRTIAIGENGAELLICPRKDRHDKCLRDILGLK
jgi:hypothetical protein